MKKIATSNNGTHKSRPGYAITDYGDHWIARDEFDHCSGYLVFYKRNGRFSAGIPESKTHFPRLARGYKDPKDCPVDENHVPKSEFLMFLALREKIAGDGPSSDLIARGWREMFFMSKREEIEGNSDRVFSKKDWARAMEMARDASQFADYAGVCLVHTVKSERAADHFRRLALWLEKIEQLEAEPIPAHYQKFFRAVESAAEAAQRIPNQKEVQAIYESDLNRNQKGEETGFRNVMRHLCFGWLPAGGRGVAKNPKISGIKSKS
jgi:hypothetical protein